jgi:hypothetical protein
MFPESVKKALEAAGISESSLDRVRLAQGVVGKASYVAGTALLALMAVAISLREPVYLLAVAILVVILFLGYLLGSLWFSHKHPDMALLEGAELVKWRQIEMAAKGLSINQAAPPQPIGRVEE